MYRLADKIIIWVYKVIYDAFQCTKGTLNIELLTVYLFSSAQSHMKHWERLSCPAFSLMWSPLQTGRQNHHLGIIRSLTMPLSVQRKCYHWALDLSATDDNQCSLWPYLDLNLDQSLLNGYYGHFGVSLARGRPDTEEKIVLKPKNSRNYWNNISMSILRFLELTHVPVWHIYHFLMQSNDSFLSLVFWNM